MLAVTFAIKAFREVWVGVLHLCVVVLFGVVKRNVLKKSHYEENVKKEVRLFHLKTLTNTLTRLLKHKMSIYINKTKKKHDLL